MSVPSTPAAASLSAPSPVLRGSPTRTTDHMEALQKGYVRAIAAAAGVIASEPDIDEGIDLILTHTAKGVHKAEGKARLEVQLKSTTARISAAHVSAQLSRDRFEYFSTENPTTDKLIVIMAVPRNQEDWVKAGHSELLVRNCSYWVNIAGEAMPAGLAKDDKITVRAPKVNVFDDIALCRIMERIGQGGRP
ncbi:DUF4365 domain-containing protein [Rhodococcus hoagii]|nr:DUF4365 domain-containing protein [Prescottella equi]